MLHSPERQDYPGDWAFSFGSRGVVRKHVTDWISRSQGPSPQHTESQISVFREIFHPLWAQIEREPFNPSHTSIGANTARVVGASTGSHKPTVRVGRYRAGSRALFLGDWQFLPIGLFVG